uniref:E3 ubiquitin-protein ligase hrd-1 n=1 Tax=Panagrellus redivivus TaxID=6233 RepID=A0A7E4WA68_PANRE
MARRVTLPLIVAVSFACTALTIVNALILKKQFYPSVVYITKNNLSMAVVYAQGAVLAYLAFSFVRYIFFGQLRAAEVEHATERVWHAVMETCLAFAVFRDDFSPAFVIQFVILFFVKAFHWLAEDRVDYMERIPLITLTFHARILGISALLAGINSHFMSAAYFHTVAKGASAQIVFGFEYAVLMTMVLHIVIKYLLHTHDLQQTSPWESKAVYMLYAELLVNALRCILFFFFFVIMMKISTFPLFAIRQFYLTIRSFQKALNDVIQSRRAIHAMNHLFPLATAEELSSGDPTCIICREEMTVESGAKKLPCNHIFHPNCLRSWFQRQQTCPTCRTEVLATAQRRPNVIPGAQAAPAANGNAVPGAAPAPPLANGFQAQIQIRQGIPMFNPNIFRHFLQQHQRQHQIFQQGQAGAAPAPGADGAVPAGQQAPAGAAAPPPMPFPFMAHNFGFPPPPPMPQQPQQAAGENGEATPAAAPQMPTGPFGMPGQPGAMPMPFGFPPPMLPGPSPFRFPRPPATSGLSDEELRALEGTTREAVEARIQALSNVNVLLDAAVLQFQQYLSVANTMSLATPPAPTSTASPPAPTPDPDAAAPTATTTTEPPAPAPATPADDIDVTAPPTNPDPAPAPAPVDAAASTSPPPAPESEPQPGPSTDSLPKQQIPSIPAPTENTTASSSTTLEGETVTESSVSPEEQDEIRRRRARFLETLDR